MKTSDLPQPLPLSVALIGYGGAARVFHAPLISGVPGLHLHSIVSRQHAAVAQDWPQVRCVPDVDAVYQDPSIDLVVIATPNASHFELAQAALKADKHVVVDKPCTVTLAETQCLLALAQTQGKLFTVFQNRRFDSDFLTLQQVIKSGALGRVVEVNSHFDRYRPQVPVRWREQALPGAGLWFDLGPHLLDQAVVLFGAPDDILLDCANLRTGAVVNDWFHAVLRYTRSHGGLRVVLHASTLVADGGPRWAVHGERGSFTSYGLDGQEEALKQGARPHWQALGDWGENKNPGQLLSVQQLPGVSEPVVVRQQVAGCAGNYLAYYSQLCDHLQGLAVQPCVTTHQIHTVMKLLTFGEQSAQQGRWVSLTESCSLPQRGQTTGLNPATGQNVGHADKRHGAD